MPNSIYLNKKGVKGVSRFINSNRFIQANIDYVVIGIRTDPNQINFTDYFRTTYFPR